MTITDIADDTGPVPAPVLQDDPTFGPPPDDLAPGSFSAPSSFASSSFGSPLFEPPPEWESMPDPRTLSPHVQRQLLLGRFLDDAEVADRQLAVSAAR
ncbi:hypothetical protein ABIE21_003672, partial [Conyzicola nivalis]